MHGVTVQSHDVGGEVPCYDMMPHGHCTMCAGNYFVVYAYQYTDMPSAMLLDCFAIPMVLGPIRMVPWCWVPSSRC